MKRFRTGFRGCKSGDPVPDEWTDEIERMYPSMIEDDDADGKAASSPKDKMINGSPKDK
jgi:hypothetical protein